jgi:hypothetical protein
MSRFRFRRAVLPAALLLPALAAAPAAAHVGDPNYRSVVREIAPPTNGLSAQVVDHDDALLVVNRSDLDVTILDPDGKPYARLLADGTVQVNPRSGIARGEREEAEEEPAGMGAVGDGALLAHAGEEHPPGAHRDGSGGAAGPPNADGPRWSTLDRTGRLQWHDPRINHRGPGVPPQVTDRTRETKVEDWRVPIVVGGERGAILGTLTWVGEPGAGSSFPTAAVVSLGALALLGGGAVVLVRRRRAGAAG